MVISGPHVPNCWSGRTWNPDKEALSLFNKTNRPYLILFIKFQFNNKINYNYLSCHFTWTYTSCGSRTSIHWASSRKSGSCNFTWKSSGWMSTSTDSSLKLYYIILYKTSKSSLNSDIQKKINTSLIKLAINAIQIEFYI